MRPHYHVTEGMNGYMPDNEPETYRTKRDAGEAAKWRADLWREFNRDTDPDYRVTVRGNKRDGYVIDRPNDPYYLPIYISIEPCTDPACLDEEDN